MKKYVVSSNPDTDFDNQFWYERVTLKSYITLGTDHQKRGKLKMKVYWMSQGWEN